MGCSPQDIVAPDPCGAQLLNSLEPLEYVIECSAPKDQYPLQYQKTVCSYSNDNFQNSEVNDGVTHALEHLIDPDDIIFDEKAVNGEECETYLPEKGKQLLQELSDIISYLILPSDSTSVLDKSPTYPAKEIALQYDSYYSPQQDAVYYPVEYQQCESSQPIQPLYQGKIPPMRSKIYGKTQNGVFVTLLDDSFYSSVVSHRSHTTVDLSVFPIEFEELIFNGFECEGLAICSNLYHVYLQHCLISELDLRGSDYVQRLTIRGNSCDLRIVSLLLTESDVDSDCDFKIEEIPQNFPEKLECAVKIEGSKNFVALSYPYVETHRALKAATYGWLLDENYLEVKVDRAEKLIITLKNVHSLKLLHNSVANHLSLDADGLRSLKLPSSGLRFADFKPLQNLNTLDISNNPELLINEHYIPASVETLVAGNSNISKLDFAALRHLKHCDVSRNSIAPSPLSSFELVEFYATNCTFSPTLRLDMRCLPLLRVLQLECCVGCVFCPENSNELRTLSISSISGGVLDLSALQKCAHLRYSGGLQLSVCGFSECLEHFFLSNGVFSSDASDFSRCARLESLELPNCIVYNIVLTKSLKRLSLPKTAISQLDLRACANLQFLDVSFVPGLQLVQNFIPAGVQEIRAVRTRLELEALPALRSLWISKDSLRLLSGVVFRQIYRVGTLDGFRAGIEEEISISLVLKALLAADYSTAAVQRIAEVEAYNERLRRLISADFGSSQGSKCPEGDVQMPLQRQKRTFRRPNGKSSKKPLLVAVKGRENRFVSTECAVLGVVKTAPPDESDEFNDSDDPNEPSEEFLDVSELIE